MVKIWQPQIAKSFFKMEQYSLLLIKGIIIFWRNWLIPECLMFLFKPWLVMAKFVYPWEVFSKSRNGIQKPGLKHCKTPLPQSYWFLLGASTPTNSKCINQAYVLALGGLEKRRRPNTLRAAK